MGARGTGDEDEIEGIALGGEAGGRRGLVEKTGTDDGSGGGNRTCLWGGKSRNGELQ